MVIFKALTTEESIAGQQLTLGYLVCPTLEDPDGCWVGVVTWWGKIAQAIFTETGAAHVCHGLEPACDLSLGNNREWNCQICKEHIVAFFALLASQVFDLEVVLSL